MKNFATYEEFLHVLKSAGTLEVTTDYGRLDTWVPYVNRVALNRLKDEGCVKVEPMGRGKLKVSLAKRGPFDGV